MRWCGVPRSRLGVALLLPPVVSQEVDGLRRALGVDLARIAPHITLVPPVNVREDRLEEVFALVRRAAAATSPLTLRLGPPASFLPDTPVIYLRVGGDLDALRALRDGVFVEPLARALTWPWLPHVTLADDASPERIAAAVTALDGFVVEAVLDRVHVLRESPGRIWEPIADAAFRAAAVSGRGGLELELSVSDHLEGELPWAVTARRAGVVVGVASGATAGGGVAELHRLWVLAGERRKGVGSRLLAAVESLAAERGCDEVTAVVPAAAEAAAFFAARGWAVSDGRLRRRLG